MNSVDRALKTLLVVEDSAPTSAGLVALLSHFGYMVTAAGNGRVAQQLVEAGPPPDAILLDMRLPEVDGWRFLDWIKDTPHKDIPVIVTTGTDLTREWTAEHGAAGFLHKPLDEDDLLAELERVLGPE